MPDPRPDDEDDHAWLLARERGKPGPAISEVRARHYAQLDTLISGLPALPAGTVRRDGWQQAVLAAIDAEIGEPAAAHGTSPPGVTLEPRAKGPPAKPGHRRRVASVAAAVCVMAAMIAIVGFMLRDRGEVPVRTSALDVGTEQPGGPGSPPRGAEVTRGIQEGRLGFEHVLQVRRSVTELPRELHDGDTVMTGDRIRASVMTSADAYVYLVFCGGRQLQTYPSQRGVHIKAGAAVLVPEGGGELVLDNQPGSEVLYLILSRDELSLVDPSLGSVIAATRNGQTTVDCGSNLDLQLMKSTGVTAASNVLRGERIRASSPGAAVATDADGIAIVRYRFTHVASELDPRPSNGLR
jgi:hypothetical protein